MYPYITENNLLNKQKYNYSEYRGMEFLSDYRESRLKAIAALSSAHMKENCLSCCIQGGTCKELKTLLENGNKTTIDKYVKSFEVRKRLYTAYDENMKPMEISEATYSDFDAYIFFAKVLLAAHKRNRGLKYFSCLLKLDDTLISVKDKLSDNQKWQLAKILTEELSLYDALAAHIFAEENT